MFDQAIEELRRARDAAEELRGSRSERDFLVRFNAFVASAQGVLIAMLKEGRGERLPGFAQWYESRRQDMDEDEVLVLLREARDFDFDAGPHRLRFVSGQARLQVDELGRPVDESAWCALPASPALHVMLDNAPETHEGARIERRDPLSLSDTVLACLEQLLDEANAAVS